MKIFVLFPGMFLALTGIGHCTGVPGVAPGEFTVSPAAGLFWEVAASAAAAATATWIAGRIANAVIAWRRWREDQVQAKVVRSISAAADHVYQTFVRAAKAGNGGKLTIGQKDKALAMAVDEACAFARREGLDLIKAVGKDMIPALVESIVRSRKSEVANALAPLPALSPSAPSV